MNSEKLSYVLFNSIDISSIFKNKDLDVKNENNGEDAFLAKIKKIIDANSEISNDKELDENLQVLKGVLLSQILLTDDSLNDLSGITKNQIRKQIVSSLKDSVKIYVNYLTYHNILVHCTHWLKNLHDSHIPINQQSEEAVLKLKTEIENAISSGLDSYFAWFNNNNVANSVECLSDLQLHLGYAVRDGKKYVPMDIDFEEQGKELLTRYVCEHAQLAWKGALPITASLLYSNLTKQVDNFGYAYLSQVLEEIFSELNADAFQQKLLTIENAIDTNDLSSNEGGLLNKINQTIPEATLNDTVIEKIHDSAGTIANQVIKDKCLAMINHYLVKPEYVSVYAADEDKNLKELQQSKSLTLPIDVLKAYLLRFTPTSEAELNLKQKVLDWLFSFEDEPLEEYKPLGVCLIQSLYHARNTLDDNKIIKASKIVLEKVQENDNQKCAQALKDALSKFIRAYESNKFLTLVRAADEFNFKEPSEEIGIQNANHHFRKYAQLIEKYNSPGENHSEQFTNLIQALNHLYTAGILGEEGAIALLPKSKNLISTDAYQVVQELFSDKLKEITEISPLYKDVQMQLALLTYGKRYQKIYNTPGERLTDIYVTLTHFMNVGAITAEKFKEILGIDKSKPLTPVALQTAAYKLLLLELTGRDPFAYLYPGRVEIYPFKVSRHNIEALLDKGIVDDNNKQELKDFYFNSYRRYIQHNFKIIKGKKAQNGYELLIDAKAIKEIKIPIVFVDIDTQEEIGRFYRKEGKIHFDGLGNNIDLTIEGTLEEECYVFDSDRAKLQLDAHFSTLNDLNIIAHANEINFKGKLKSYESINIETVGKINISKKAQINCTKQLYINAASVENAGQINTGSTCLKLEEDIKTTSDSVFSAIGDMRITTKGNLDLHGNMISKDKLEIISKGDINFETGILSASDQLNLSAKSMHTRDKTQIKTRYGYFSFADSLNIDKGSEINAKDIVLSARNISNHSSALAFYTAKIHAADQFVNYKDAQLKTINALSLTGNSVLNQGKLLYGNNLNVNLTKDFVNGVADEQVLQKLMKENIKPTAKIIGKDANIIAHTCANLYGKIKTYDLTLTCAIDFNAGIYKTNNAKKTRLVNIDTGYNLINLEACSADLYKYLNRVRNHNYLRAFQEEQAALDPDHSRKMPPNDDYDYAAKTAAILLPTLDSTADDDYRSSQTIIPNIKNSTLNTYTKFNIEQAINIIDKFKTAHMEGSSTYTDTHVMIGEKLEHSGVDHSENIYSFVKDYKENGAIDANNIYWSNKHLQTSKESIIKANTAFINALDASFNGTQQANKLLLDAEQLTFSNTSKTRIEDLLEMYVDSNMLNGELFANTIYSQAKDKTLVKGPIKSTEVEIQAGKVTIQNDIVAEKDDKKLPPKVFIKSGKETYLKKGSKLQAKEGSVVLRSDEKINKEGDVETKNYIGTAKQEYSDNGSNKTQNMSLRAKLLKLNSNTEAIHALLHAQEIKFPGQIKTPVDAKPSDKPSFVFKSKVTETTKKSKIENPNGTTAFFSKDSINTKGTNNSQRVLKKSKKNIDSEETTTAETIAEQAKGKLSERGNTTSHHMSIKGGDVDIDGKKTGDGKEGASLAIESTTNTKIADGAELSKLDALQLRSQEEIVNEGKVESKCVVEAAKRIKNNKEILAQKLAAISQTYTQRGVFEGEEENIKSQQTDIDSKVHLIKRSETSKPGMRIKSSVANMNCDFDGPDAELNIQADEINLKNKLNFNKATLTANKVHDDAKVDFKEQFAIRSDDTEMTDKSHTNGEGSFVLDSHKAKIKNINSKQIILKMDHVPYLDYLLLAQGMYNTIHAREVLGVTTKDHVHLQNDMVYPMSVLIRAPTIAIASNIYGQKSLGFDAYEGDVITFKNVIANNDLSIEAKQNYINWGNVSAGNNAYFQTGIDLKNIGGKIFFPKYVQIDTDGNVINEVICVPTSDERNPVVYTPGRIYGGIGDDTSGVGLYLKAKGKFINDGSEVYTMGTNYIDAYQGIESTARLHQYLSYHKKWHSILGHKETTEYKYHVQKPLIYSSGGQNIFRSHRGGFYSISSDLFAKEGNDIYAFGNVDLLGLKTETVCEKRSDMLYGFNRVKERNEYNVPTYVVDYANTRIHSENDINILNAYLVGRNDLYLLANNVTVSQPKLEHSYEQKGLGFEFKLPNLSIVPGYSVYLDAREYKNANNNGERIAALWNTGVDTVNTFNDAITVYRNKLAGASTLESLAGLCAPTVELAYTHSHTKIYTETLADNTGIHRGGSLFVKTNGSLAFLNGVPVYIMGDAVIDSPRFIQQGAALISSNESDSVGATVGIGFNGPNFGVNASIAKSRKKQYANQTFYVGGKLLTNIRDWQMIAANTYANSWIGKVGSLSIVTPLNESYGYSTAFEATTAGRGSFNYSRHHSKTIVTPSGISVESDLNTYEAPLHVDRTYLEGAKILSGGVNNYETDILVAKDVKEKQTGTSVGISGNFGDQCSQAIRTADTQLGVTDIEGTQQSTIFGAKGTYPKIKKLEGNLNTADASGYKSTHDVNYNVHVKVPLPNKGRIEKLKDNLRWLQSQAQQKHQAIPRPLDQWIKKSKRTSKTTSKNENVSKSQDDNTIADALDELKLDFNLRNKFKSKFDHSELPSDREEIEQEVEPAKSDSKLTSDKSSIKRSLPFLNPVYCSNDTGDENNDQVKDLTSRMTLWNQSKNKNWKKVVEGVNGKKEDDRALPKPIERDASYGSRKSLWPKEKYGSDTKITIVLWDSHLGTNKNEISATGHMSYVITENGEDTTYSIDPGICKITKGEYIREQKYRNGYALKLNLSHEDASKVAEWFKENIHGGKGSYCSTYNLYKNNCAAPIQEALRKKLNIVLEPVIQGNQWRWGEANDAATVAFKRCPPSLVPMGFEFCVSSNMGSRLIKSEIYRLSDIISFKTTGKIIAPTRVALAAWSKGLIDKNRVIMLKGCHDPKLLPIMQNDRRNNPWRAKVSRTIDNCTINPK